MAESENRVFISYRRYKGFFEERSIYADLLAYVYDVWSGDNRGVGISLQSIIPS